LKKFEDVKVGDYLYVPFQKDQNNDKIYLGEKPNNHIQFWKKEVIINDNLARLLGLYVAEGCMNKYKSSVIWSFGEREGEFADEVITRLDMIGLHGSKKLQVSDGTFGISRCWIVRCRYKWLYELLDKIGVGHGAHEKNIPLLSDELAKSFIGGWLDGDGSYYDGTIAGHSESKELIRKIDTMLLSLEINAQISKDGKKIKISKRDDVERVCGWTKRLRFDKNRYKTIIVYASPTVKKMKTGWAVRITKIEELPKQKVYAIEMRYKIYVANNILTHNCLPKDTKALLSFAKELGVEMPITEAIDKFNDVLVKEQGLKPLHIDGRLENLTDEDKRFSTGK